MTPGTAAPVPERAGGRPRSRGGTGVAKPVAVLLLGVLIFLLSRLADAGEPHAYAGGAPPATVTLTAGTQYAISVRGGIDALRARGGDPDRARCTLRAANGGVLQLPAAPISSDARTIDEVATFSAPAGGRFTLTCAGWGPVYVDDADDAAGDTAGALVLLTVLVLTVGGIWLVAALAQAGSAGADSGAAAGDGAGDGAASASSTSG